LATLSIAIAQDNGFDAHGFEPAAMDRDLRDPVGVVRPGSLVAGDLSAGALLEYAWHPLVRETVETGTVETTLEQLVAFNISGAWTPDERVRVEFGLPVFAASFGSAGAPNGASLGDLRVASLVSLLSPERSGVGVGLFPYIDLPTGDETAFLGQSGVAGGALAAATIERQRLTGTAHVGAHFSPEVANLNVANSDAILVGLAGSYAVADTVALGTEIWGRAPVRNNALPGTESPWEWMGTVRWVADRGGFLTAGLSTALSPGVGAPGLRAVVGGGWARQTPPAPRIEMATLNVSVVRQGAPMPDVPVRIAGPEVDETVMPGASREVPVGSEWSGLATLGPCVQGSGSVVAGAGRTDLVVELRPNRTSAVSVRVVDGTGAPVPDATVSLLAADPECAGARSTFEPGTDGSDVERVGPGFHVVRVSAPGRKPFLAQLEIAPWETRQVEAILAQEPVRIRLQADRLVTLEPVHFETGKANILPQSFPLLDEIAATLVSNPDLGRVRVEGHTDSQGGESFNMKLSAARAEAVVRYLVERGVPASRLLAKGFGATQPLTTNRTEQGRAQNRRVEFVLATTGNEP
jgi:outer membrane protein OmpA-like peptidoglycan-associated protein